MPVRPSISWLLALAAVLPPALAAGDGTPPGGDQPPAGETPAEEERPAVVPDSPGYLERLARNPAPRTPRPDDDIPSVVADLTRLLQDNSVPGFYDGQYAVTADRFDELVRVARDRSIHHTMRIMAVMALPEAVEGDGARLLEVLEPLILPAPTEYHLDWQDFRPWKPWGALEEAPVRKLLDGDLSRYVRFALAKAGQTGPILEKIEMLEMTVSGHVDRILDPNQGWDGSARGLEVLWYRKVWFDIGYHYQQFDDYENAARYFRALSDNLRGEDARWAYYNLACIASLEGRLDEALELLGQAIEAGFADLGWMDQDGDLAAVRTRPEYETLREQLGAPPRDAAGPNPDTPPEGEAG